MKRFPNSAAFICSRTGFASSAAVMSIVGYIVGLGDRHCENILIDQTTGRVMHVDFNCLFEKGLKLEKPELVPFRLTHNMVDAMGVTGYEGVFRSHCEHTTQLLRKHKDPLMSVLDTFVHDPLLEWNFSNKVHSSVSTRKGKKDNKDKQQAIKDANIVVVNEFANYALDRIRLKLDGYLQYVKLSANGQVDELIKEAVDPYKLFKMYIGWASYL
ncbi:Protein kinase rad3 [Zancudomyces culisetae]|uniref:non-specific serine/threonine protein kinase n=1 Tax=Zancudomyces culisetae TaxID=1213189 RepID=A0A1R1PY06_ZANCU|nr:Protein kinase rad3 [Zancudomyces culisetae]|eukprot:OMH85840.1 Protein kinase rad3 [Zancudomyces culisetae]